MSELKRTDHAVYELKYHFVWIPKYRKKVLTEEIKEKLKKIFLQIAEEYDFEIIEQQVMSDHVHLFLSVPPRYSPARLGNIIYNKEHIEK
ncbi:MAG TPA: IS200/IS605 family transposase [Candidatus Aerophobetes bacterium]|nr:IS200/IS605 family transposase [Candidatus Aerophobetes bacterium]